MLLLLKNVRLEGGANAKKIAQTFNDRVAAIVANSGVSWLRRVLRWRLIKYPYSDTQRRTCENGCVLPCLLSISLLFCDPLYSQTNEQGQMERHFHDAVARASIQDGLERKKPGGGE
jgi:hypothetical protein